MDINYLHQQKVHHHLASNNPPKAQTLAPVHNPRVLPVIDMPIPIGPMRQSDYGHVPPKVIFSSVYDEGHNDDYVLMSEVKPSSKCVIL